MTKRNRKSFFYTPMALAVSAFSANVLMASPAFAAEQIQQISVNQIAPDKTQLRLTFQNTPVAPVSYQQKNPDRLVLDFAQVQNGLSNDINRFNVGLVNDVVVKNNGSTTRLIVGMKKHGKYDTNVQGNQFILTITDPTAAQSVTPISSVAQTNGAMSVKVNPLLNPAAAQVTKQFSYDGLTSINATGNKVVINLSNDSIPLDVQRQGNQLVVRMSGATIPRNLLRRFSTNGLIANVDTKNQGKTGVITLNMSADYEYQAYQSGNQLHISVMKPKMLTEPTLEEKVYKGQPLSMEFQDVSVRSVLDVLAQFTDMNIVATDSVVGNITLRLVNVPWDQALDIILKSKGLGKRENNNVIWVAPAQQIADQELKELEAKKKVREFSPLRTEYIRLSYAKAPSVLTLISQGRNSGSSSNRENSGTLLSERGTVTVDERTNTLIVKDTTESIANIRALVKKIDIPVKQVMIEARIVSASDTFSKELGVRWGILSNGAANNRNLLVGGSNETLWNLKEFDIESTTVNGRTVNYPKYTISRPDNLNVDLGVANPAGRIAFGLLTMSDLMLDLELSAMQADNRGEVISSPKVLTADKQTAKVSSGTQIPYQEAAASGATSTSFKEAALSLEVTPNITPDGKIGLELDIKNGSPTIVNGQVAIKEDAVNTNVIVEDGQTVVLGGVFKNTVANGVQKVPFLGDLPFIGRAFRNDLRTNNKEELLIFITPKLINDGVSRIN